MAVIYTICGHRHSGELIYIESIKLDARYCLLNDDEGSTTNLVISGSEEEDEKSEFRSSSFLDRYMLGIKTIQ